MIQQGWFLCVCPKTLISISPNPIYVLVFFLTMIVILSCGPVLFKQLNVIEIYSMVFFLRNASFFLNGESSMKNEATRV
ncbi:hypothetical protein EDC96DRAFT_527710 [Choanephora cucurbitarum]|nr:hypothetical protein EDC96DRAFT_527710 [Choanephora cucurbitarum]